MKTCKHCGAEIAKSAKVCPVCGGKNKKPIFKRFWFWLLIIVLVILGIMIAGSGNQYKLSNDASGMSEDDFKAACQEIDYKDLLRDGDKYKGEKIMVKGEVVQVIYESEDGSGESQYRVSTGQEEYLDGYFDDDIMLYFKREDAPKLLEEDIVTIYGEASGTATYTTVLGSEVTVPVVTAVYVDMK